jgi:hypothetical protein
VTGFGETLNSRSIGSPASLLYTRAKGEYPVKAWREKLKLKTINGRCSDQFIRSDVTNIGSIVAKVFICSSMFEIVNNTSKIIDPRMDDFSWWWWFSSSRWIRWRRLFRNIQIGGGGFSSCLNNTLIYS